MPAVDYKYKYKVVKSRVKWLERGLKEIIHCSEIRDNYGMIEDIAKSSLNGEPTSADEHNKVYISDVNKEIVDEMNEAIKETPEYQLGKRMLRDVSMQFGGDTGTDADYYDENNEEYINGN